MNTVEIRKKLIEEINLSENRNLLEELYSYLNQENKSQETYKLSNVQNSAIAEAREQIIKGDYLTNEQADKVVDEWLRE
ncbi:hypothetical protein [Salegentibacter sp. Hel_I_6]|uniref:hypothetical protein n=1 Tax=Salegentibacter sp. Hel_I_6 TaxID=1250278 RepID=UPI00056D988B|nr:hypothetical protein [Salegentibacter sp. Hel_I_6]